MSFQRLDKVVAFIGNLTRSQARHAIKQGKVRLNGEVIKDISIKVDTESDKLSIDGQNAVYEEFVYYLMNKPKGVLSASRDKQVKTVLDLILPQDKRADLFCVGRLDKDTTGLLIITDDGQTAHKILSPKSNISKVYEVTLDGEVTEQMVIDFENGVTLADGTKCLPAKLESIDSNKALVTIMEGKYHQVKRMFGTVGLGVNELKRISIGGLMLPNDLLEGEYIKISFECLKGILG